MTGEIDGQAIDETFTAGPETFSTVIPRSDLEFPPSLVGIVVVRATGGSGRTPLPP